MGLPSHDSSPKSSSPDHHAVPKLLPNVDATDPAVLFKRAEGKTFETESLEDFYKPIAEYEGAHRYDPKFEWEEKEEKRVVRKIGESFAGVHLVPADTMKMLESVPGLA